MFFFFSFIRRVESDEFEKNCSSSTSYLRTELHSFLTSLYIQCRKHPLWKGASEEEMDNVIESIEKFVTSKLYRR